MNMPLILFFIFTGCAFHSKKKELSPQAHFEKALTYKEKKDYVKALETLKELRKQFFYSPYSQKALLLTADIHFAKEDFSKAIPFYKKHLSLYSAKQKNYVLYHLGMAYKSQLPKRPEHDLSLAEPALKAFQTILDSKSPSPYKSKAQEAKQKIIEKKANKELKTALFFKQMGWNQAGLSRINYFIINYPKSPLLPKALFTGFQLASLLNKNSDKFKQKLIKNHPHSKEAQSLKTKSENSIFNRWRHRLL